MRDREQASVRGGVRPNSRVWRAAPTISRPQAARALREHATEFGHRLFGVPAPPRDAMRSGGDIRPGAAERLAIGQISCLLVPRALEAPTVL